MQGVEEVIVYCVNDGAVMSAWGDAQKIAGTFVTFVGDPHSDLTKGLDMTLDHPGVKDAGIINRCKRHVFLLDGGKAHYAAIAESPDDPAGDHP